ncbi:PqqD family protein [Nonomuraea endophytica]|uniref:PqqD family protein n=1 Tax=Nonomuraea endophytica TaxID=714136 RepID=UPI0037C8AB59
MKTWAIGQNVVWTETEDEVRLYDTTAGEFQTLNQTASAIWRQLVRNGDQGAIVTALAAEFGAQDDNQRHLITSDAERFLRALADAGLVVEQGG